MTSNFAADLLTETENNQSTLNQSSKHASRIISHDFFFPIINDHHQILPQITMHNHQKYKKVSKKKHWKNIYKYTKKLT